MAKTGKRARRMSIDTNNLSTACLRDILAALEAEKQRGDESPYPVTFGVAAVLLLEILFLKGRIKERTG